VTGSWGYSHASLSQCNSQEPLSSEKSPITQDPALHSA